MIYSDKVMDHFSNPRNVGVIADADGVGEVGNPVCGDMMTFYIKVKDGHLSDVKFQTFGCGAAIAVSSMVSEMAKGKTLDEAKAITNEKVAEELGGLPKNKLHCSNLGADALHVAIKDFEDRAAGLKKDKGPTVGAGHEAHDEECCCPYCEGPLEGMEDVCSCSTCNIDFVECASCGKYTNKKGETCVNCGAQLLPAAGSK
jgi:nitrogen fixation NifU-like protein